MAERVMFIQLKTGHDIDQGPTWISSVRFNKTWNTAYWHGRRLHRWPGMFDANFYDVETGEKFWVSGPHRDGRDVRYSGVQPTVDDDIRAAYEAFRDARRFPAVKRADPAHLVSVSMTNLARGSDIRLCRGAGSCRLCR